MPYVTFLSSYFFFSRMHVSYFVCVFANSIKKQLQKKKKTKTKKNTKITNSLSYFNDGIFKRELLNVRCLGEPGCK